MKILFFNYILKYYYLLFVKLHIEYNFKKIKGIIKYEYFDFIFITY